MNSDSDTAELNLRAQYLRGAIISSYALVEFLLTDLNMRCRSLPAYAEIASGFPYSLKSKITRTKTLAAASGPLSAYADDVLALVDRISAYEDTRHFIAHGQMVVSTQDTAPAPIMFRMYRRGKKDMPEEYGTIQTDADQLANLGREIAEYSHQMVTLFERIYRKLSLDPGKLLEPNL
jgi:hypothetical protein